MRYLSVLFLLASASLLKALPSVGPQVIYKADQLPELLRQSKTDSVMRIERQAALEFHKLINIYRREQKTDTLQWNDTLWLASRNHCLWMNRNNLLSHGEDEGTELYSGSRPGDRYNYVVKGRGRHSWSGENALYNWSGGTANAGQAAKTIARESFNQWKNSPGHNSNMLNPSSKVHGVAFIINRSSGQTWGTDLFTYSPGRYSYLPLATKEKEKQSPASVTVVSNTGSKDQASAGEPVKLTPSKIRQQLLDGLYGKQQPLKDEVLAGAAAQHARYLSMNKAQGHTQVKGKNYYSGADPKQRVQAAAQGFDKVRYRRKNAAESVCVLEIRQDLYNRDNVIKSIQQQWLEDHPASGSAAATGIGIEVKRVKDMLRIYAVKVELE